MYYQRNKDRTAVYLFFSKPNPKILLVGASYGFNSNIKVAEKHSVGFGGVPNTAVNRRKYDFEQTLELTRGGLWMMTFRSGVKDNRRLDGKPFEAWVYYATSETPWGIRVLFKGSRSTEILPTIFIHPIINPEIHLLAASHVS